MFCPKCGAENTEGNKYCQKCGAALAVETPKPTGVCAKCGTKNAEGTKYCQNCGSMLDMQAGKVAGSTTSLEPNVAGLLCYLAAWITGLIFILIEKENKFVRFHAMQSIVTFGAIFVVCIVLIGAWASYRALAFYSDILSWILAFWRSSSGLCSWSRPTRARGSSSPSPGTFAEKNS